MQRYCNFHLIEIRLCNIKRCASDGEAPNAAISLFLKIEVTIKEMLEYSGQTTQNFAIHLSNEEYFGVLQRRCSNMLVDMVEICLGITVGFLIHNQTYFINLMFAVLENTNIILIDKGFSETALTRCMFV